MNILNFFFKRIKYYFIGIIIVFFVILINILSGNASMTIDKIFLFSVSIGLFLGNFIFVIKNYKNWISYEYEEGTSSRPPIQSFIIHFIIMTILLILLN